jgi:glycosyltransferase involved in cell wall biosynthesis
MHMPLDQLAVMGHTTAVSSVRKRSEDCDLLVVQRPCMSKETDGPAKAVVEALEYFVEHGRTLVTEWDDDLFHTDPSNVLAHSYYSRPIVQANMARTLRVSNLVTVTNAALAEVVLEFTDAPVAILPNCIDESLLDIEREPNDRVTVGWAGSGTHHKDWQGVPVKRFLERHPKVGFRTVGAPYGLNLGLCDKPKGQAIPDIETKGSEHVLGPQYDHTGWLDDHAAYYRSLRFDIGIIPLRPSVFNRSKSYLKALEMAALGIPVVCADTGPYPEFVQHGVTGFLVRRDHEWEKYLRQLVNDDGMRREMGKNARELAGAHTIQHRAAMWQTAYRRIL